MRLESNCWDCGMQQTGYCTWFKRRKKIPSDVADKGCQHFRKRNEADLKADTIIQDIIKTFNGEIIRG
tara:strand:- start:71 stop:274 length:204 start_codon:yes stop_codon:yes gene_type:complete